MVHQDQLFVIIVEDMISHDISHQVFRVVNDRESPVLRAGHFPARVLRQLMSVELHRIECHHHSHRRSKIQIPGRIHSSESGCDDRAVMLLGQFGHTFIQALIPDNDQHACALLDQDLLRFLIAAGDHDAVSHFVILQIILIGHGENTDFPVQMALVIIIDNIAVDRLGDILRGCFPEHFVGKPGVIEGDVREVRFRHPAYHFVLIIYDREAFPLFLFHQLHCLKDRRLRCDRQRSSQIYLIQADLCCLKQMRLLESEPVQKIF